jgi:hypothetical protein
MIPLVLELDEELKTGEEMTGVKTILCEHKGGYTKIGYVAVIRKMNKMGQKEIRYGSLKAIPYVDKTFGDVI